jgi:iron complex outermembrane receptor protein
MSAALMSPTALAADEPLTVLPTVEVSADETDSSGYINLDKQPKSGKIAVSNQDAPYSVSVVDQTFIQDTGAKNIQDALLYSSGVNSGNYGFDTRGDWAKVRGLNASYYVDGMRSVYGYYNSVRPNVFGLDSVEVLKGPSSVLYGQGELGGIINAVSKLPQETAQGEIWAQAGSFERKQLAADVTGPLTEDGKLLYRMVALKRDSDTQVDYVEDDGYVLAPSLTWQPSDETSLTLLINRQENTGQVSAQFLPSIGTIDPSPLGQIPTETFVGEPGWDRYDRDKTEVSLLFRHGLTDQWSVAGSARYGTSSAETREHWVDIGAVPDAAGNVGRTLYTVDRNTEVLNMDVRAEGDLQLGQTHHTLALGVDHQNAMWEEDNYYYGAGQGGPINLYNPVYGNLNLAAITPTDRPDNRLKQIGVYAIDHIEIGRTVVSAALRHDESTSTTLAVAGPDQDSDASETTGRLGLMYRFDSGISPYVSYSTAFNPNLGGDGLGGTLEPTTGKQTEGGVKYLSGAGDLAIAAAYFDIEQENRIVDGATPGGVEQTGAVVHGWEVEIKKHWKQLELLANYTNMHSTNDVTGHRLSATADRFASAWAKYTLVSGIRFGAGVRYNGDTVGGGNAPKVDAVTLYDAMMGYRYKSWDFSVDAKNLSDKTYVSWCRGAGLDCGYGERRNVTANARYLF